MHLLNQLGKVLFLFLIEEEKRKKKEKEKKRGFFHWLHDQKEGVSASPQVPDGQQTAVSPADVQGGHRQPHGGHMVRTSPRLLLQFLCPDGPVGVSD